MQYFTALFTIFAIIISVNAAAIHKRAAPNVNSCINSINSVSTKLDVLGPSVIAGGIFDVNNNYNNLENDMRAAQSTCCAVNAAILEADADEVLASLGTLTPKVQKVLSDISSKEHDYSLFSKIFVRTHIKTFDERSQSLHTCFTVFTPPSKTSILEGYFNQITTAFTSTKAAYGI